MAQRTSLLRIICSFLLLVTAAQALRFELESKRAKDSRERCIRNFVGKDTLVVVTAIVSGNKGDGQTVNIQIRDMLGNEYGRPRDVAGEKRVVFTALGDAAFDVCFENIKTAKGNAYLSRDVELDIDIGADAKDWAAIQANEKLKPIEAELRHVEEAIAEVVDEMEYLRSREQKLRDTNESTNSRVKFFGIATTWLLVGLWAWQIMYLRAYFRSKHLI
ncbi:probable ERV25 protein (component of the COPII-coated vesicles) [Cephalotrichum gorgonifer]|uniref:Probable ERV25 protein (Component of the COPII-coated vesicles) n=1 Tax=Cephalotrichum gorgonifer TaxID=2041049 RepID=A0AAE8MPG6_9PEZI|nr:probable ERV25 protein (component of the COPII-coated vesicles) [Cephalotrichum gorgonifer]